MNANEIFPKARRPRAIPRSGSSEAATPEPGPARGSALQSRLRLYRRDVVAFSHDVLSVKRWDPQQLEVLAIIPEARRIAVKSGHATGKTFLAAVVAWWRWFVGFPCGVITTAPTGRQVKALLWSEIRDLFGRLQAGRFPTKARILKTTNVEHPHPKALFTGFATKREPTYFQGFHRHEISVIMDEAGGVAAPIWSGIEGVLTGADDLFLAIGNPTFDLASDFFACFTRHAKLYRRFTLDSEKSSWCSKTWLDDMAEKFGVGSPIYNAKVKGEFPKEITDGLIALAWIERAQRLYEDLEDQGKLADPEAPRALGVDVARFGSDETTFAEMIGIVVPLIEAFQGSDLMKTTGQIVRWIKDAPAPASHVRIDDAGLGGGVTDRLHEQGFDVVPVNAASEPNDKETFKNTRAEIYWALRDRFRDEGRIAIDPDDDGLLRDLVSIRVKPDSSGRIQLEKKEDTKKRLGHSPDRADALALAAMGMQLAAHAKEVFRGAPGSAKAAAEASRPLSRPGFRSGLRITRPRRPRR